MHAGYAAPLDASARSFVDAWQYGTRESPALWVVILASGIVGLAIRYDECVATPRGCSRPASSPPPDFSFFSPVSLVSLPPLLIGAGIAAGLCARRVASIGPRAHAAVLLLTAAIAATLVVPADQATARYADFYRVVDESLMRAATAIAVRWRLRRGRRQGGPSRLADRLVVRSIAETDQSSSAPIRDG